MKRCYKIFYEPLQNVSADLISKAKLSSKLLEVQGLYRVITIDCLLFHHMGEGGGGAYDLPFVGSADFIVGTFQMIGTCDENF